MVQTLNFSNSSKTVLAAQAWITRPAIPLAGASTGPLAGLRFAAKDNIDVQGLPLTAACPSFGRTPTAHATVVQKLLDAGASVVGKTNLDQFACGLNGTRSPYGAVPNAFNPLYISGGSSSGSAYVVATGQVDFALGTDTAGSGRVPAGLNNIVGLKPSKGLISTHGVLPAAHSVDCVSIFAGTVALAAQVLQIAMGRAPGQLQERDAAALLRIAQEARVLPLTRLGQRDVAVFLGGAFEHVPDELSALVAERYAAIRPFFDTHEADVIEPVRSIIAKGRSFNAADVFEAQSQLHALEQTADVMWDAIDVLLLPTAPTHYTIAAMQADPVALNRNLGAYTNFVNLLDYAALSVPSSLRDDGLPFGITLIGPCASDWQLAELGQRYHHATGLPLGATGKALPAPQPIAGLRTEAMVRVAVVGAHLSGMPLNGQLRERGARLLTTAQTAPHYRLFALPDTTPPKPGLIRVTDGAGGRIAVEIWEMPAVHYGSFVALIPAPLGIGMLELADGSLVQGFVCEGHATHGATDITHMGGWRTYIASLKA